jgi:hypothetical protein
VDPLVVPRPDRADEGRLVPPALGSEARVADNQVLQGDVVVGDARAELVSERSARMNRSARLSSTTSPSISKDERVSFV